MLVVARNTIGFLTVFRAKIATLNIKGFILNDTYFVRSGEIGEDGEIHSKPKSLKFYAYLPENKRGSRGNRGNPIKKSNPHLPHFPRLKQDRQARTAPERGWPEGEKLG